jgi:glycosyltransferase involved in cell wall biosynthesis
LSKVLVISGDTVNRRMGGTAIRYWEFARILSQENAVTLAIPNQTDVSSQDFPIVQYNLRSLADMIRAADVVVAQRVEPLLLPLLLRLRKPTVIDLYSPYPIESLAWLAGKDVRLRRLFSATELSMAMLQLQVADHILCATEEQRNLWIGALLTVGRITPEYYDCDPNLEKLTSVVPFGLPADQPQHTEQVLKGIDRRIRANDRLLIWNGGLWSWLDPLVLVEAMSIIAQKRNDVKLFFMGTRSPNPNLFEMSMYDRAVHLSQELGSYGQQVIFNDGWIPYQERQNYLLEADLGICTYSHHIETRFSFRTRLLDCIWCRLPVIVSGGDWMSKLVRENGLGKVVTPGNAYELADAVLALLDSPTRMAKCKTNLGELAQGLAWDKVTTPLRDFCQAPHVAQNKQIRAHALRCQVAKHYARRVVLEMCKGGIRGAFGRIRTKF